MLDMSIFRFVLYTFLGLAIFFNTLGVIGLLRFPDVYTRLHAATKCTTFGSMFLALAVIGYGIVAWARSGYADAHGITFAMHSTLALVALLLTNPTGAHALARAAHRGGVKPYKAVVDRLAEVKR